MYVAIIILVILNLLLTCWAILCSGNIYGLMLELHRQIAALRQENQELHQWSRQYLGSPLEEKVIPVIDGGTYGTTKVSQKG